MREVNFSIPSANKAAVSITTTLYDRRALDCTSTLPLISSLNYLAYLTTSSARIRDILTVDGGIEQLVNILKQGREKNMMEMWKWNLAFQCVVNIGVCGSESVRTRVVQADVVPVIATVLQNYLKVFEKIAEAERKQNDFMNKLAKSRSVMISSSQNPIAMPPGSAVSGHGPAVNANANITQQQQQQQSIAGSASRATTNAAAAVAVSHQQQQEQQQLLLSRQIEARRSATGRVTSNNNHRHHHHHHHHHHNHNHSHQHRHSHHVHSRSQSSSRVRSLQDMHNMPSTTTTASNAVTAPGNAPSTTEYLQSASQSAASSSFNSTPSTPGALNNTVDPRGLTRFAQPQQPGQDRSVRTSVGEAEEDRGSAVPMENVVMDSDRQNGNTDAPLDPLNEGHRIAISNDSDETNLDVMGMNIDVNMTRPGRDNVSDSAIDDNTHTTPPDAANSSLPFASSLPSSVSPVYLGNHPVSPEVLMILPREEDVLMALQLLAYVSKYCSLRPYFQKTHMVPRLQLREDLYLLDHSPIPSHILNRSEDDDEEFLLPDDVNIFPIVEKFTTRQHSDTMRNWACVVMRNLCRKNDARGGIRQCAHYECGKWEDYQRQFAKCRRCRRTKYCSKECQKNAWVYHRHWCRTSPSYSHSEESHGHHYHSQAPEHQQHQHRPQQQQQQQS